jgi:hypothetical protein
MEEGVNGLLGLHLRHARALGHAIHDVEFDHFASASASALRRLSGEDLSKDGNTLRLDNRDASAGLSRC